MTLISTPPQPRNDPGIANAEDGLVILDGPNGLAITMTAHAAAQMGQNLIAAAEMAEKQLIDRGKS